MTYVKGFPAEPAEHVFAPLAHHLRAACVPLDGHAAHGTRFDVRPLIGAAAVQRKEELGAHGRDGIEPPPSPDDRVLVDEALAVLGASLFRVPVAAAEGAKFLGTALALHSLCGVGGAGLVANVTQGSAVLSGAPRSVRVQGDL